MKTTLTILSLSLIAAVAQSAFLFVNLDGGTPYTQVQPAVNAASAGDTIVVAANLAGYQGFNVDRRLVIIGAGYGTGTGQSTQIAGVVTLLSTADSTELWSLWIRHTISSGVDSLGSVLVIRSGTTGIFISRCLLENYSGSSPGSAYLGYGSTADFLQTIFWHSFGSYVGLATRSASSANVVNCVFSNLSYCINQTGGGTGNLTVRQCVFAPSNIVIWTTVLGTIQNCAFMGTSTSFTCPNMTFSYCGFQTNLQSGTGNLLCTSAAFVNLNLTSPRTSDYHLAASSVLRDAGNPTLFDVDSTRSDIGIYGGLNPMVDNGVPAFPFVSELDVPMVVPQSGAVRFYVRGVIGSAE